MNWFRVLQSYGEGGDNINDDDEDFDLIPKIVEKVVIPKAITIAKAAFDPFSSKHCKLARAFVDELRKYEVKQTDKYKALLTTLADCFVLAVEEIKSRGRIDLSQVAPSMGAKVAAFNTRNLWAGIKVFAILRHT